MQLRLPPISLLGRCQRVLESWQAETHERQIAAAAGPCDRLRGAGKNALPFRLSATKRTIVRDGAADLRGQLFLCGTGDHEQQTVVDILHRGRMPKALV